MDYTKKQISEITGLPLRLVQFYTEEGVVTPDIDEGKGRGRRRKYSRKNLKEFLLIRELTNYGITLQKVKFIMDLLSRERRLFDDLPEHIEEILEDHNEKTYIMIFWNMAGEIKVRSVIIAGKGKRKDTEKLLNQVGDEYRSILIINFTKLLQIEE